MNVSRIMIVGLDCAEPSLVLDRWRGELPAIADLMARGMYGRLTSVIPPITVPAWSCMMASRTPGDLGIYGFRNRADHSYERLVIADGSAVVEPRLWDLMTRAGKRSIVVSVPGTYPPRPLNGALVSCFLTPPDAAQFTYPRTLRREIEGRFGEYLFDCRDFRTADKEDLLRQLYEMTDRRFAVADYLLGSRPWELFAMVEIGTDRIHHAFWRYMDPRHRKHEPDGPYATAILDYYRHVDGLLANLLRHADETTAVLVVSDHGAKPLDGAIRVNEWLRREGYLTPLDVPAEPATLSDVGIDWTRTVAWAEGGYHARIFLNVRGREPQGVVAENEYDRVRSELAEALASIPDDRGGRLATAVYRPEELYPAVNGVAPDLIVHFGDLSWRSAGTIGGEDGIHLLENDTGPDDANHAQDGLMILAGPGVPQGERSGMHLLDVAPTVLDLLGLPVPASVRGRSLLGARAEP